MLMYAEALNEVNGAPTAEAYEMINAVRHRAGLDKLADNLDKNEFEFAMEHERQVELFTEWGHRWLDLKRTNRADAVLGPIKAPNWQPTDMLYPIPQTQIANDPNVHQNPGY